MKRNNDMVWGDLGILLCSTLWGFSYCALQAAQKNLTTFWILTVRFGGTVLLMSLLLPSKLRGLTLDDLKVGCLTGMALSLAVAAQIVGVAWASTGKIAFLTAGYVVAVPFFIWALSRQRPPLKVFMAAALCMGGMGALSLDEKLHFGIGELSGIAAALLSAVHLLLVDRLARCRDPLKLSLSQSLAGTVFCGLLALMTEPLPSSWSWEETWIMVYLIIFCTLIPYAVQFRSQMMTTTTHAAVIFSLESVFAVIIGVIWLGEPFTWRMAIGFALVMASILLTELNFTKKVNS